MTPLSWSSAGLNGHGPSRPTRGQTDIACLAK
jgi:hypothetical protein